MIPQSCTHCNQSLNKNSALEKFGTQFMFRLPVRELTGIRLTFAQPNGIVLLQLSAKILPMCPIGFHTEGHGKIGLTHAK
jgi:hypothetical protein